MLNFRYNEIYFDLRRKKRKKACKRRFFAKIHKKTSFTFKNIIEIFADRW